MRIVYTLCRSSLKIIESHNLSTIIKIGKQRPVFRRRNFFFSLGQFHIYFHLPSSPGELSFILCKIDLYSQDNYFRNNKTLNNEVANEGGSVLQPRGAA